MGTNRLLVQTLGGHTSDLICGRPAYSWTEMKFIRLIFVPAITVLLTIGLRLLSLHSEWIHSDTLKPFRINELMDLLTGWGVPFYFGAWVTERKADQPLKQSGMSSLFAVAGICVLQWYHIGLGPTFLISAPLSLLTGGLLYLLHEIWLPNEIDDSRQRESVTVVSDHRFERQAVAALVVSITTLVIINRFLVYERLSLPLENAQELSEYQAVLFTQPTCHYCQQLGSMVEDFQQRYPTVRLRVVEQMGLEANLLRERLNAAYNSSQPTSRPVPALFTAGRFVIGADAVADELSALSHGTARTLGVRFGYRGVANGRE